MVKPIIILVITILPLVADAQKAFNPNTKSLSYNSHNLLQLTKTNIRLESQYSQAPQIYSASQASYTRLNLESGIIGFGFIPLKIEGYYSTESQTLYNENYFRISFDLNLLIQEQKNKALNRLEEENRKLIYYKRDFDKQKNLYKSKAKYNDSLTVKLKDKLKATLSDTLSDIKNKYKNKLEDTLTSSKKLINQIPEKPNLNDSVDRLRQKYQTKAETYANKNKDSLSRFEDSIKKRKIIQNNRARADSTLKQIDKLKAEKVENEKKLNAMSDSIKKIEQTIKSIVEIINNPKAKVQELIGKKVHLPKTFQIGRINPYFSESVFNGTPAKGVLVEFESPKNSTTISFGKLSGFAEPNINQSDFQSEYVAFKQGFKIKDFTYELGIFNCYKNITQGNQIFVIPFGNFSYSVKNGVVISGEFAKSIDYRITTIEAQPEGKINSGFATNVSAQIPLSMNSGLKFLIDKSSQNYRSPGNPYFISGPLKLQAEYFQSLFKDKLKMDLGIRANANIKNSGKFQNQTLSLRLRSNFQKNLNFSLSYLPIQSRSEFHNEETRIFLMQTNVLNMMAIWKKRFKGYFVMQNLGFWTKSQEGLVPDFESKNYFYSLSVANSKNNKATLNYNFGKGHTSNDSLNQVSVRLILEYGLRKNTILTTNFSYAKSNYYTSQHTYLVGIKRKIGFGVIWLESGGQKTMQSKVSYIGRVNMNFSF